MANVRQPLKPYKGYDITKINHYIYRANKPGTNLVITEHSLPDLKKHIRELEKTPFHRQTRRLNNKA